MSKTQYVTISFGGRSKGVYTYKHDGKPVTPGSQVWIDARDSGVRPAEVVATSSVRPSKKPAPDGYKGPARSETLR